MKIQTGSSVTSTSGARSKKKTGSASGSFSEALETGSDDAPVSARGVSGTSSLGGLLSIQEVPDALTGRQKAKRHAENILDELDELRIGLLLGTIPIRRLERIESLVAKRREEVDDPRLLEILNEIEVRAAVELAKLGR
ncbi:flagellar assembly protein FliX [Kiloniella laminariae]|uniref:Flagellar assembly protein FliX n=1 Tax=Kiloniella laminariae TaxID=454162 RepID=A0ABT4LKH9_9PROT|nr:flagellar assembly protein FliX [Kiloniella laminariae]MCZ4280497.1 flagellar assembly protein FliX [Kiloniella laminariae]